MSPRPTDPRDQASPWALLASALKDASEEEKPDLEWAAEHGDDEDLQFGLAGLAHALRTDPTRFELARREGSAADLGELLLEVLPRQSDDEKWDELVGPFYDYQGAVARLDGITTRQGLDRRRDAHQVLGCRTSDGHWLYPTFQFSDTGDVLEGLPAVVAALEPVSDGWSTALWLRTDNEFLDGRKPAELLGTSQFTEVIAAAVRQRRVWSGERVELVRGVL